MIKIPGFNCLLPLNLLSKTNHLCFFSSSTTTTIRNPLKLHTPSQTTIEFSLVAALKFFSTSLVSGQQLHAFALKSGLSHSNLFVRNGLLNLYGKCRHLDDARRMFAASTLRDTASWNIMISMFVKGNLVEDARELFDVMPRRDCVSFTTMIMGLAQNGRPDEALVVFADMVACGVMPNEVTFASVVSACADLCAFLEGKTVHGVAVKCGLVASVLVSTNLVHLYATCFELEESRKMFDEMLGKNVVTWNAMLNGYAKAGRIESAIDLFDRMPSRDVVSWSTMMDGYLRTDRLDEAMFAYRSMLRDVCTRPNEVLLSNLISACGRLSAFGEGQQLHTVVLKDGLHSYDFLQSTLIHFYAACHNIEPACLQFSLSSDRSISCWNAMMAGFIRNGMMGPARRLFDEMPERDVVSWSTLIAGYVHDGQSRLALDYFEEMRMAGIQPNEITLVSVLAAVANSGSLEQGKWIHNYINENKIPLTDNLSAGLIDMYAKHGSIKNALQVFGRVKEYPASVSPWNAIICGLAMHGLADMSLDIFMELQKTEVKPNSITFIGVLAACCHAGLVETGRRYFESMKCRYNIEPTIKHYGCMVDLFSRAGHLEEAERLIERMPMKPDVMIWGSLLAACRNYGNVDIGERAAESLARLDAGHGAGRLLLSNIYADAGRWDDVFLVRRAMQGRKFKKEPGYSGIN